MREYTTPAPFTINNHNTVADAVFAFEHNDPHHIAFQRLIEGTWTAVTAASAAAEIRAVALGLIAHGVCSGDRVAILSSTRYEWVILDYAIMCIGAVTVPIYETSSAEQICWILQDSGAVAVFTETPEHYRVVTALNDQLPALRSIISITSLEPNGLAAVELLTRTGRHVDMTELSHRRSTLQCTDLATVIYTSGTTGRPKGCQLTHRNLLYEIHGTAVSLPTLLDKHQRLLVFLPLAHVLSRALSMAAFAHQVTLGYTSNTSNLVPILAVFKPTVIVGVPRIFEKVYNSAELNAGNSVKKRIFIWAAATAVTWSQAYHNQPGLPLRLAHKIFDHLVYKKIRAALGGACNAAISGGAPLGTRLGHFYRGVGISIYEGYGLTETSAAITINHVGRLKVGTVGTVVPGNSIAIADDGELLVKGGVVFNGYWNNDQATREAITDGWFHTGDLASIDSEGFLSIVGRKKDIIVTASGKNVAPAVLEDALRAHPLISQAVIVGNNQPFIGALITLDPDAFDTWKAQHGTAAVESVRDACDDQQLRSVIELAIHDANQHVSHAESIRKFRILPRDFTIEAGELTPTLKIKRNVITEKFAADIAALYSSQ